MTEIGLASAQMADNATMGNMTGGNMTGKVSGVEGEDTGVSGYAETFGSRSNGEGKDTGVSGYHPGPGEGEDD